MKEIIYLQRKCNISIICKYFRKNYYNRINNQSIQITVCKVPGCSGPLFLLRIALYYKQCNTCELHVLFLSILLMQIFYSPEKKKLRFNEC